MTKEELSLQTWDIMRAWRMILAGRKPALSIEITRECPLSCPGCYAYDTNHLGGSVVLRELADRRGRDLVDGILRVVDSYRPIHVSLVGGEPLVRYRELSELLPILDDRKIKVQLVTSAVRPIPPEWSRLRRLTVVVSIDGLQPEHDARRKPATYDRILKHIQGHRIVVHCTVTRQMTHDPDYFRKFLEFWSSREEVRKIWISLFTPQKGEANPEVLPPPLRQSVVRQFGELRSEFRKLDMPRGLLDVYLRPPENPDRCVFAGITHSLSADLERVITPCQFGGTPDCSQCGCVASAAMSAVARHRLPFGVRVQAFYDVSRRIGEWWSRGRHKRALEHPEVSNLRFTVDD